MIPIPEELLDQIERGNVLLFIGERILRDADGQVTVDRLTNQLVARCEMSDTEALSFPEVAQVYEDKKGRHTLVQFLRDQLEALGDEPQHVHHLIAGLSNCGVLITTSLTSHLERAFEAACRPLDVVIGNVDVAFEDEYKARLYKLRGSLDRPESLILTEDDHELFFRNRANLSLVLQGYLARKTILFIGYDLAEPLFKRLYYEVTAPLDNYARRAYAFGETPSQMVSRWCARRGIDVIEVDTTVFLKALTERLEARAQPISVFPSRALQESAAPLPERPYKLLDYYEARDAGIFFGRSAEIQKLSSLTHAHRLLLLYGASGTGKTSLLLAGAMPRLERADPPYETIYVRTLEDPALVIRRAVGRKLPETSLPQDSDLVDFLDVATRALGRTLVIVLDQFEEFFIRQSTEFRAAFVAKLGALYDARDVPIKVVLSLREDWLASVGEIEARIPEVFRTKMRLLPLTREQAQEAIIAPVEQLGVSYEPALVEHLLDDLAGSGKVGVMPTQLQLVCSALYDSLGTGEHRITLTTYGELGGARGVLQRYLDDELARLGRDEGILARAALEELVTSQGTKGVKSGDELAQALTVDHSELAPVLEKLARARLLRVLEREDSGVAYELAHEYLIAQIVLSPEAVARKEAEELIRQGVENRMRFGALLPAETFALIDTQRDRLRFDAEAQKLMLRSALRLGRSVGEWLGRVKDVDQALILTEEELLAPEGEPARQNLGSGAGELEPGQLRALVIRLAESWHRARGQERTIASDTLWALRPYLPGNLRLRLALSRSPRQVRRLALPLAGAVVAALAFVVILWGPRLWTAKPDITWVDIPAGEFLMGSDPEIDDVAGSDEMPAHQVSLDTYRIGKYEVTNEEYGRCVRAKVCPEPEGPDFSNPDYASHPVVNVSWMNAQTFCKWVGGRLPTEAEWEYAARGSEERVYPWGSKFEGEFLNYCDASCEESWRDTSADDGYALTAPVGSYPEGISPFKVHDMAGNVWEWVADWYASDYYSISLVLHLQEMHNPQGPDSGQERVIRGGSWFDKKWTARTADRQRIVPSVADFNVGFRCVNAISEP